MASENKPADSAATAAAVPADRRAQTPQATDTTQRLIRLEDMLHATHKKVTEYERLLAQRDEYVDKLHNETQQAKKGLLHDAVLPLVRRLLFVIDDLGRQSGLKQAPDNGARDAAQVSQSDRLASVADVLRDILASYGVEFLVPQANDSFDAAAMCATATRSSEDPELAGRVAATVREGARFQGRVLRPAEVLVWRLVHNTPEHPTPPAAQDADSRRRAV